MDKPFVGYDKQYSENYDKIFKKSLLTRINEKIDKFLFHLFLEEKKGKC
jgi:hypothetical protein